MCGINGFTFEDRGLVKKMNAALKHRGPDDMGVFVEDGLSLGHQRLSIIDLSKDGRQPMWNHRKDICIVYNGEMYNYKQVRNELEDQGYSFQTKTDTEVILHLFDRDGTDAFGKINGMFAMCIWDKRTGSIYLVRDRIGIKPLYYTEQTGELLFSSEMSALLVHPKVKRDIDVEALNSYFRMLYVPAPKTMLKNIYKLLPGHYLEYKDGKSVCTSFVSTQQPTMYINKSSALVDLRSELERSIKQQLTLSDRPVGVFLSGGIDSTIVASLATQFSSGRVNTFSVQYDIDRDRFNADSDLARRTAQQLGTDHHSVVLQGKDALDCLPDVIRHMDEPIPNPTALSHFLLSRFTSQSVTVALGGDGADELFGGYDRYRLSQLISRYQSLPKALQLLPRTGKLKKFATAPGIERYMTFLAQKEQDVARVLSSEANDPKAHLSQYERFFSSFQKDAEYEMMQTDLSSWLPDQALQYVDRMSMAHGLEMRVPYLDNEVMRVAHGMPSSWNLRWGGGKAMLKKAFSDHLPDYITKQPKRGWFTPASAWMRRDLNELVQEACSANYVSGTEEFLDFPRIEQMLNNHLEQKEYALNLLWAVVVFQMWYKTHITE